MRKRIHLAVLFGGRSCEHEVSVASARSIVEAIDPDKYEVTLIGISKEGRWLTSPDARKLLEAAAVEGDDFTPALLDYSGSQGLLAPGTSQTDSPAIDVIFPVLHGPYGEDGTVQGMLELSGIPYVGAGVVGSAVGMDKEMMRRVFRAEKLPQVNYSVVRRRQWQSQPTEVQHAIEARFPYPFFIKPVNLGSSVGISKIHNAKEFVQGMDEAASFDHKVMIEAEAVNCREVEAAVIGNEDPQAASAVGEIAFGSEFYDYETKYTEGRTEIIIPARISPEAAERIRAIAISAFKAVDAAGLSRVDFFVSKDDETIFLNEINTIPGFTPFSMYPKLWTASGVSYTELIDRLIQLALDYHGDKRNTRAVL